MQPTAPTAIKTPAPKAGYLPPHLRKAAAAEAAANLDASALADTALFPSLGGPVRKAAGAWGARAAAAATPSLAVGNSFAALDDVDTPKTGTTAAGLNFKEIIEERIRREKDDALRAEEQPDIFTMSADKLDAIGYGLLKIPKRTDKEFCIGFHERLANDEDWHADTFADHFGHPIACADAPQPIPDALVALRAIRSTLAEAARQATTAFELRRLNTYWG